jgi:hypothetical protein
MILIRETTPEELASIWKETEWALSQKFPIFTAVDVATLVLRQLQVKADIRPMTLPDADPSSLQLCTANRDASR